MADPERSIAGIRCREILAELSQYVDGELAQRRIDQIQTHLRECDWCERFGGEFAGVVTQFRKTLAEADPLGAETESRLRMRLREELGRTG